MALRGFTFGIAPKVTKGLGPKPPKAEKPGGYGSYGSYKDYRDTTLWGAQFI